MSRTETYVLAEDLAAHVRYTASIAEQLKDHLDDATAAAFGQDELPDLTAETGLYLAAVAALGAITTAHATLTTSEINRAAIDPRYCANPWHRSAPARLRQTCPECDGKGPQ